MHRIRPPAWFRILAIVLVLWGVAGVFACVQQFRLGAEAMGPASAYDRALYATLPVWYNAIYAVAVGCGLAGALALVVRTVLAIPLFALSLVAVLIQFGWLFAATDIVAVRGAAAVIPFPVLIALVSGGQIWLARHARTRRWIG